jgi:cytosine/adenosine deaminase-related metal-dependent hydrolase
MSTFLIPNAAVLVTMDEKCREIPTAGFFVRDGWIEQVGPTHGLSIEADEILDLSDHIVLPSLINTHHHLFQTLTCAIPAAQDSDLFQ